MSDIGVGEEFMGDCVYYLGGLVDDSIIGEVTELKCFEDT